MKDKYIFTLSDMILTILNLDYFTFIDFKNAIYEVSSKEIKSELDSLVKLNRIELTDNKYYKLL